MEKIAVPSSALPNPLREGLVEERIPEPATMVNFGASGDLARRKLLPALYSLTRERMLPGRFAVIGYARRPMSDDAFRAEMRAGCEEFARRRPVDPGGVRGRGLLVRPAHRGSDGQRRAGVGRRAGQLVASLAAVARRKSSGMAPE